MEHRIYYLLSIAIIQSTSLLMGTVGSTPPTSKQSPQMERLKKGPQLVYSDKFCAEENISAGNRITFLAKKKAYESSSSLTSSCGSNQSSTTSLDTQTKD